MNRRTALFLLAGALTLSACGKVWKTDYMPITESAKDYRLAGVSVTVPETLTVSESELVFVPDADIVWVEEPEGDRRAQVAAIFDEGVRRGASGLRGRTPVRIEIVVSKFHALNMKSRTRAPEGTGVYDIRFTAQIVDARSGAVLVPAQAIAADAPANTGAAAAAEEAEGTTQRTANVDQIARTIAGWLGTGPDNRKTFNRMGG